MFIVVRYGDDKSEIFNPNCRNHILLENIKMRCNCQTEDVLELSDETGTVKNIRTNPSDYGTTYFNNRETLVLVRVEQDDPAAKPIFVPLLSGFQDDLSFIANLNPSKASPPSHSSGKTPRSRKTSTASNPDRERRPSLSGRRNSFHRQRSQTQLPKQRKTSRN